MAFIVRSLKQLPIIGNAVAVIESKVDGDRRLVMYDSKIDNVAAIGWKAASATASLYFQKVSGVRSPLEHIDRHYDEIQLWCHGSKGYVYFGGKAFDVVSVLNHLNAHLRKDGIIWIRACSVVKGDGLADVMKWCAAHPSVTVFAHTEVIHVIHGGTKRIRGRSVRNVAPSTCTRFHPPGL